MNTRRSLPLRVGSFVLGMMLGTVGVVLAATAPTSPDFASGKTWPVFFIATRHNVTPSVHFVTPFGFFEVWGLWAGCLALVIWTARQGRKPE